MVFQIKTRMLPNACIIYFYFFLSGVSVLFPWKRMPHGPDWDLHFFLFALVTRHNKWTEGIHSPCRNRISTAVNFISSIPSCNTFHSRKPCLVEERVTGSDVASIFSLSDYKFQFFLCCLVTEGNWPTSFLASAWTEGKELSWRWVGGWLRRTAEIYGFTEKRGA